MSIWKIQKALAKSLSPYQNIKYNAETSLSSRNAEPTSMNAPLTYPVGTGNVIGSHSAQDFIWAGRAEGETATHTPEETNTPYAGPITEPIGSEIKYGAEKIRWSTLKTLNYYIGGAAVVIGLGGILGVFSGGLKLTNVLYGLRQIPGI